MKFTNRTFSTTLRNENKILSTKFNKQVKYYETVIELNYILSEDYLVESLNDFILDVQGKHEYISLMTKLDRNVDHMVTLYNKTVLNLNNKDEITKYIEGVKSKYNEFFNKDYEYIQTEDSYVTHIRFCYNPATISQHTSYNRKINLHNDSMLDKKIDRGIKDLYNLPLDNLYESWGDIEIISSSQFIITNSDFNDKIDKIVVKQLGSFRSMHYTLDISFIDNTSLVTIIDKKQDDDYIKRIIRNVSGTVNMWYTFNPHTHTADLMVNYNRLPKIYSKTTNEDGVEIDNLNNRLNVIRKVLNYDDMNERNLKLQKNNPDILDFQIPRLKAITLDCETYLESIIDSDGKDAKEHKMLAICFYDGLSSYKFYRSYYNSDKEMLNACFDKLFVSFYHDYNIYIHNGSKFDLVLLINYLLNREDTTIPNVIYKNGNFLQLTVEKKVVKNYNGKVKTMDLRFKFKDSYLLLQNSLAKLGESFNVDVRKDIFPYKFPNKDNLCYIGEVPLLEYFDNVSIDKYNEYVKKYNKKWNMKYVVLDYCIKDCISLYQVISKFKDLIDNKFKVDMQSCPTITSLAFKIFKANYYEPDIMPIPSFDRELYDNLHKGYYGGHVDMYIPEGPKINGTFQEVLSKYNDLSVEINEKYSQLDKDEIKIKFLQAVREQFKIMNHYDVNSLYPSTMSTRSYPTDMICEFIGDLKTNNATNKLYENQCGIYKVRVNAPNIKHPILPTKIGGTSIYGYGEWEGWYYSDEIKNAEKYGYKFEILGGYIFESKNIFEGYIKDLYEIKENSSKGTAMYLISKLLMNSLYGRFGMNTFLPKCEFLEDVEYSQQVELKLIDPIDVECIQFENHVLVITPNKSTQFSELDGNISVALAITAYSRIRMCEIKNKCYILYYTDTDSGFLEGELPVESINGKKIGYWTHEAEYLYCVFLGPKSYACFDINGNCYSKVKGYSSQISIEEMSNLLNEKIDDKLELSQEKWKRFLASSKILIKKTTYDLIVNNNKRELVYENGRLTRTENKLINGTSIIAPNNNIKTILKSLNNPTVEL